MGQRLEHARALYLEAIRDGDYVAAINAHAGDRYTQHSTPVRDGREGFIAFFADFVERNPVRDIEIVRGFEDGRYVFLHVVQDLNDGEHRYVTADIFDTDDDAKLIEHWDIIDELRDTSQVGGPTEPTDLAGTVANKGLVARFVDAVLIGGDHDRFAEFVASDLVQHSPDIADGLDALRAFTDDASVRYRERHLLIGCGDLVAVLAACERRGTRCAVIDLYRVAHGRIVEHWDVIEEITPEDTWVNTGKF